jgi:putative nucleotidyltransferase with HDIG domain
MPERETLPRMSAEQVVRALQNSGYTAYFAGGCVRDTMLGKEPKDYDVATSAQPEQLKELFPSSHGVGAHFGVVLVKLDGHTIEIATFRSDGEYTDGRRPQNVTFASPEEDAQRRDFTINGLFFDPVANHTIDYVGGGADLEAGVLRAIGDPQERFEEDHLRLMRAVRFAAGLGFDLDSATWNAVCDLAPAIEKISVERVRDEFSRILTTPTRVRGFDLLVDSGLMGSIMPEILNLKGCEQPPKFHPEGNVFVHTRLMLSLLPEEASLPLVLSVLLHDIGKPATYTWDEEAQRIRFNGHAELGAEMTEEILRRLKYPNDIINDTVFGVANHMRFMNVQDMRTSKLKRFMARETFDDEMELHRVDCLSSNGMLDNYHYIKEKREEFANEPLIPPRLVTGDDLIARQWKPGPVFKGILTEIQNLQLEGTLTSREQALDWLAAHYPEPQ